MKKLIAASIGGCAVASLVFGGLAVANAPGPIDFEAPAYSLGSIHGQNGWSSSGLYDHKVDQSFNVPGFGVQSLRISNAVVSGSFGDQTFSPSLAEAAGESGALTGGVSNAPTRRHFEASWQFASVTRIYEPDLSVVASPDRGDGARMSWVQMADKPAGLEVNFNDYQGNAFVQTTIATGLSRAVPHAIRITMDFFDGSANDVVKVYVDGVLAHTGTSWEDYFRDSQPTNAVPTVDSVLFRTGGVSAPAALGKGFLIDNLDVRTDTVLSNKDQCKKNGWMTSTNPTFKNQGDCVSFLANKVNG